MSPLNSINMNSDKKIQIIIHGAINLTNFGDILFSTIFYNYCKRIPDCEAYFAEFPLYGVGGFVRQENHYTKHLSIRKIKNCDLLVYMSGGYFGDNKNSLKLTIRRYLRYVLLGEYMKYHQKKIVICGIGGGPIFSSKLRDKICSLFNYANLITTRDEETAEYFIKSGVTHQIKVTADTALIITPDILPALDNSVAENIDELFSEKKIIFVHLIPDAKEDSLYAKSIIPAINEFTVEHSEFGVIVGTDGIIDYSDLQSFKAIKCSTVYNYQYTSAWQLCSLLNRCDLIITAKLHVGIVGSSLGKSCISFPIHAYKTKRFYEQINEDGRCIMLDRANKEVVYQQLLTYYQRPILIPQNLRRLAAENLHIIDQVISSIKDE